LIENPQKQGHGGNIWAASKKWGIAPQNFIDFSASINPLGPSPRAIIAVQQSMGMFEHYPEPEGESFKSILSQYLHIDKGNLVLGNGGSEIIYLLGRMFGQRRTVVLAPCFSEYGAGVDQPKIYRIELFREDGFKLPLQRILDEIQENDLIFIANPNNPTGNLFPREELLDVVKTAAKYNSVVVVDEAFMDFIEDKSLSLVDRVEENKNLIIIGSLTKFFALAALRLGYAVANRESTLRMENLLPPWRINGLALVAASVSVTDHEYIHATFQTIKSEKEFLTQGLERLSGLKVYPGVSNFILVDAEKYGLSAQELQELLGPQGILIRNNDSYFNLSRFCFRLAIRTRQENYRLLEVLEEIL
jgi:threonine-phosphate decarboxylase